MIRTGHHSADAIRQARETWTRALIRGHELAQSAGRRTRTVWAQTMTTAQSNQTALGYWLAMHGDFMMKRYETLREQHLARGVPIHRLVDADTWLLDSFERDVGLMMVTPTGEFRRINDEVRP